MAEAGSSARWRRFDAFSIDVEGHRVLVDGVEVPLERKAFGVLLLLAGEPGRVFRRDEILDAVWGHTHVTSSVLNRVIGLIRLALGERTGRAPVVHTVHGVGYRLDAVAVIDPSPVGEMRPPERPIGARSTTAQGSTSIERSATAAAPASSAAALVETTRSRHPWLRSPALAVVIALLVLGGAYLVLPAPDAPVPHRGNHKPSLVVLPLRALPDTDDGAVLADGLSEELITRLSRVEGLRVISISSSIRAQKDSLATAELVERLHVTHALEGSLREADGQLRIDLRLVALSDGETIWARTFDRRVVDVFLLQRDIAEAVAGALALRLGLAGAAVDEGDPALFRDYLQARQLMREPLDNAALERAGGMLRSILERDAGHARARASLALLMTMRHPQVSHAAASVALSEPDAATLEAARREATRALDRNADLPDALFALARITCGEGDWPSCIDLHRRALVLDPGNFTLRSSLAARLGAVGFLEDALRETELGLAYEPLSYDANFQRGRMLDTLGRHQEAKAMLDTAAALWDEQPWRVSYARWFNALWRHDVAAARVLAEGLPLDDPHRASYVASSEAMQDPSRWPHALDLVRASERATARMNFLKVLAPDVDVPELIAGFEPSLRDAFPSYYLLLWQDEYRSLRARPEFIAMLERAGIVRYWNERGWPPQCAPEADVPPACD